MTKRVLFRTAELERIANVANNQGVTIELGRDGTNIRVMPFRPAKVPREKLSSEEDAEAALAKWEASRAKRS